MKNKVARVVLLYPARVTLLLITSYIYRIGLSMPALGQGVKLPPRYSAGNSSSLEFGPQVDTGGSFFNLQSQLYALIYAVA